MPPKRIDRENPALHTSQTAESGHLLPFQRNLLAQLLPPPDTAITTGDALLILARGLGMRSIVSTLLKIYDTPDHLVLIVNASGEEERSFAEEVGMRMKIVGFELPAATRESMYKQGGLFSVTSRILVVDMLTKKLPVELISGIIILHAETVTPTSLEAFIVRIYRKENRDGFLKAFSDQPEHFTYGLSPLQTVLQQLKLREVIICPRFHADVDRDLQKRQADVVEMYQPLSEKMAEVQSAIIECMEATLSEIKRSNTYLEVEDLTIENALFRSFEILVRRQLDPVWHKVGPRTRGLVADISTLRKLQVFLLSLDCVSFNRYLETLLSSQGDKKDQSPWLFTPAADTIFTIAKSRVYERKPDAPAARARETSVSVEGHEIPADLGDDEWGPNPTEEEEAMLQMMELEASGLGPGSKHANGQVKAETGTSMPPPPLPDTKPKEPSWRNGWIPPNIEPVLEEQPKWELLAAVLEEIENDLHWAPIDPYGYSTDTILVMCGSSDTCATLGEYLSCKTDEGSGQSMMTPKLEGYFWWKARMGKMQRNLRKGGPSAPSSKAGPANSNGSTANKASASSGASGSNAIGGYESAALKRKQEWQRGQVPSHKRRRVRGGGSVNVATGSRSGSVAVGANAEALEKESGEVADIIDLTAGESALAQMYPDEQPDADIFSEADFNNYFGIVSNEDLVIVRPYSDDDDDKILEEIRPKYVVMYDPDPSFVRRLETYRAAHANTAIRVYFLTYKDSVEEQRYLSSIRKEKDAFEKLIRERVTMAIPHEAEYRPGEEEPAVFRAANQRKGGKQVETDPPKVVVDVREFRSSLPSLLHGGGFDVVPLTISIGDYVITPEMCVERKSLPDLISSFNSGRLYQQCEIMTAHYQQPILLVEFDAKKSFNLETYAEIRTTTSGTSETDIRSKLVLLTIAFPRLRVIWSSSPYQTVDIFRELKEGRGEPDAEKALLVGVDEEAGGVAAEGTGEAGFSAASQEILRSLPGINAKNYRYVMNKVDSVEALCELELNQVQELIGVETGKFLHEFVHQDVRFAGGV